MTADAIDGPGLNGVSDVGNGGCARHAQEPKYRQKQRRPKIKSLKYRMPVEVREKLFSAYYAMVSATPPPERPVPSHRSRVTVPAPPPRRPPRDASKEPLRRLLCWAAPSEEVPPLWPAAALVEPHADQNAAAPRRRRSSLEGRRAELPIAAYRDRILDTVRESPVLILRGETGCGKSTQVPQYLLEAFGPEAHVIVTQPRRLATIALAERVAAELGEEVGQLSVGYHIGGEEKLPTGRGSIVFCTEGSLLRRLRHGAVGVSHFIIDEAHERSVDCDLLLCILRELVGRYAALGGAAPRLIVSSATVDVQRLRDYFAAKLPEGLEVPVVDVPGRLHRVRPLFLEDILRTIAPDELAAALATPKSELPTGAWAPTNSNAVWGSEDGEGELAGAAVLEAVRAIDERYIQLGLVQAVIRQHVIDASFGTQGGAVLVFLPGAAEIHAARRWLQSDADLRWRCLFVELHGRAALESKKAAFAPAPEGLVKVILSTNIAETSLTIPDVVIVIDSGLARINDENVGGLRTIWAGRANTKQRCGRAGRTRSGSYFALFTRQRHDHLLQEIAPEVTRIDLTRVVLLTLDMGVTNSRELLLNMLDPPSDDQLVAAEEELRLLYATNGDGAITGLGKMLGQLPVEPRLGLALVASFVSDAYEPMSLVVAVLCAQAAANASIAQWAFPEAQRSDVLAAAMTLARYEAVLGESARHKFCEEEGLAPHVMAQTLAVAQQLQDQLRRYERAEEEDEETLREAEEPSRVSSEEKLKGAWSVLSWLLVLGLGNNLAIHTGDGRMLTAGGHGKAVKDSMWAHGDPQLDGPLHKAPGSLDEEVLLYGGRLPAQIVEGSSVPPPLCRDVSPTAMLAVLSLALKLAWTPCPDLHCRGGLVHVAGERRDCWTCLGGGGFAQVGGWLHVAGIQRCDAQLLQSTWQAFRKLLEEVSRRLLGFRRLRQTLDLQRRGLDEHAQSLRAWPVAFSEVREAAWRGARDG